MADLLYQIAQIEVSPQPSRWLVPRLVLCHRGSDHGRSGSRILRLSHECLTPPFTTRATDPSRSIRTLRISRIDPLQARSRPDWARLRIVSPRGQAMRSTRSRTGLQPRSLAHRVPRIHSRTPRS